MEGWINSIGGQALREIADAYKAMLQEMLDYALKYGASQATLHKVFYHKFRERHPWLPTRIIKVTLTYSDLQDWELSNGLIEVRTHRGWVKIHYGSPPVS